MSKCKKIVLSCCLLALLLCSFASPFAFASDFDPVFFNFSEPYVSSTCGYIAFKGVRSDLDNKQEGVIFFYQITPVTTSYEYLDDSPLLVIDDIYDNAFYFHINGDHYTTYDFSFGIITESGHVENISSHTFTDNFNDGVLYFNSSFQITNIVCHGNINQYALGDEYPTFEYLFTADHYDYLILQAVVTFLTDYGNLQSEELELIQQILDSNQDAVDALSQIKLAFAPVLDEILSTNEEALEKMQTLLSRTQNIQNILNNIYDEFLVWFETLDNDLLEILFAVDDLESNTDEIEQLLSQILDALTPEAEVNVSKVDTSNLDNYFEAENSLLNDDNVDVSSAVNVEIDQQALVVIWDKVQVLLNTHPQVFGLVITILSISIVALVLGRGN